MISDLILLVVDRNMPRLGGTVFFSLKIKSNTDSPLSPGWVISEGLPSCRGSPIKTKFCCKDSDGLLNLATLRSKDAIYLSKSFKSFL